MLNKIYFNHPQNYVLFIQLQKEMNDAEILLDDEVDEELIDEE